MPSIYQWIDRLGGIVHLLVSAILLRILGSTINFGRMLWAQAPHGAYTALVFTRRRQFSWAIAWDLDFLVPGYLPLLLHVASAFL